jgi:hypothetical protein
MAGQPIAGTGLVWLIMKKSKVRLIHEEERESERYIEKIYQK